jgi:hypothetical protein
MLLFLKVLDKNFSLGNIILPIVVQLLKQLPAPTIDHYSLNHYNKHTASVANINLFNAPLFTLSSLDRQLLENWLQTFFVISFKVKSYLGNNYSLVN